MVTLAAAVLVALVPQDEGRLKESWPKLVEAWKAVEAYKAPAEPGLLDDELLKVAAKLHAAFDSAGLFSASRRKGCAASPNRVISRMALSRSSMDSLPSFPICSRIAFACSSVARAGSG